MTLYAIGDLHLGSAVDKPMDVFGASWKDHASRIQKQWNDLVSDEDIVCIPGDISWAMTLDEAAADLAWIRQLPGKKVMIRGNHDYWWSGISKVRKLLGEGMYALQNDYIVLNGICFAGTRGWMLPTHPSFRAAEDEKILLREQHRLELSLKGAAATELPIVCLIHYPPVENESQTTAFRILMETYRVKACLYGHLHGASHRFAVNTTIDQTMYQLVSADFLGFTPWKVPEDILSI